MYNIIHTVLFCLFMLWKLNWKNVRLAGPSVQVLAVLVPQQFVSLFNFVSQHPIIYFELF